MPMVISELNEILNLANLVLVLKFNEYDIGRLKLNISILVIQCSNILSFLVELHWLSVQSMPDLESSEREPTFESLKLWSVYLLFNI